MPKLIEIVAGPNGSGKTTFAHAYFKLRNGKSRFINADSIASGLSAGNEQQAAFHAGRVMLMAIDEAIAGGGGFAFESNLRFEKLALAEQEKFEKSFLERHVK